MVGWLLIQVATQVFPFFEIPNWIVEAGRARHRHRLPGRARDRMGFRVTPEGIKRTEAADAAGQRSRGVAWIYVVLVGAALSVGLFFVGRFTAGQQQRLDP